MQGHIRKRGKDSWTVVVDMGRDPLTGKRRQLWRSVKGGKRDAQLMLAQLANQRELGIDSPPGRVSVAEYLASWLEAHVRPNTALKTFQRYDQLIRVHIVPTLGNIPLGKLRPLHIQEVYKRVRESGRSGYTALYCHRVLREALQHAVNWQLLVRNPADSVQAPRAERREIPAIEPEQVRRLLASADETRYGSLLHLAITTGLRRGELLGLRWQDVDLDAGRLFVRRTCQYVSGEGFVFGEPKSRHSSRSVALAGRTVEVLRQHRRVQLEERLAVGPAYRDGELVFADPVGSPIHQTNLRRAWRQIAAKAGLSDLRFHDLRHAHATLLLRQGVHPKIVSERLGHSTVAITLDIYSHVAPDLQAQAASEFDHLLANG